MKKGTQRAMHCRCGNPKILAVGLCATCYTLKRQDEEYFGGLREAVLQRDGHRCRVCGKPGGRKRSLAVHHRIAGKSELDLMLTLCLAHHAMVTCTLVLLEDWPKLLGVPSGVSSIRKLMNKRLSIFEFLVLPPNKPELLEPGRSFVLER